MKTSKEQGFTLIEVLIALAIFSIIGLATVTQVRQIADTKRIALKELDIYDEVRTALSLMRYDISQAFHVRYEDLGKENLRILQANGNVPHTLFDGRKNELVFTSLSHRVFYTGLKESEQTEISFFLQDDKDSKGSTLMKREAPMIDDDLYEGGSVYRILDRVENMELTYWDPKTRKWREDWNSDGREFQDRFPLAVKVNMSVLREEGNPLNVSTVIKIAFPNNEKYVAKF